MKNSAFQTYHQQDELLTTKQDISHHQLSLQLHNDGPRRPLQARVRRRHGGVFFRRRFPGGVPGPSGGQPPDPGRRVQSPAKLRLESGGQDIAAGHRRQEEVSREEAHERIHGMGTGREKEAGRPVPAPA